MRGDKHETFDYTFKIKLSLSFVLTKNYIEGEELKCLVLSTVSIEGGFTRWA